jgi:Amt family ammonium transporter
LANGKYGRGWNGVTREFYQSLHGSDGVRGLLYGDASQLAAQLIGAAVVGGLAFGMAYVLFKISRRIVPMRVASGTELEGLDVPEMGTRGYPDFTRV